MIFMISMFSCHSDNRKSPTAPTISDQHANVTSEQGYSDQFWASVDDGYFQVNIPEIGDYRLEYTTNVGTFDILFRIRDDIVLTVELMPGNEIVTVLLQKGAIRELPSNMSQAVEIFEDAQFEMDPVFGTLLLISDGKSVLPSPTPTPPPTSTPPPTPTPRLSPTPTPTSRLTPTPTPIVTPDSQTTPTPTPTTTPSQEDAATVIVAVGDSITAGAGSSRGGYPAMLQEKLRANGYNAVVYNQGIHGADSSLVEGTFHRTTSGANIVLIMVGTNDISAPIICAEPYNCRTIDYIRSMIQQAFSSGMTPILGTVTPKNPAGPYSGYNTDIEALNAEIYQLGAEQRVWVVDTYYPILNGGAALFVDKHHLNDQGYDILAEQWYKTLVNIL